MAEGVSKIDQRETKNRVGALNPGRKLVHRVPLNGPWGDITPYTCLGVYCLGPRRATLYRLLPLFCFYLFICKTMPWIPLMCLVLFTGHVLIEISSTHKKLNETLDQNVRGQLLYFKMYF